MIQKLSIAMLPFVLVGMSISIALHVYPLAAVFAALGFVAGTVIWTGGQKKKHNG